MITIRKANERGKTNWDWLESYHTFSFGEYRDPNHMGYRHLRVINDDLIAPGGGFPTHPHNDMEIISYMLEGELAHKDSLGNGSVIKPGEIQKMTAGRGIMHSEYNPSDENRAHLLQIWLFPERKGLEPGYEQKKIDPEKIKNSWLMIASPEPDEHSVKLNQDAYLYNAKLEAGKELSFDAKSDRYYWLHVGKGEITLDGQILVGGDSVSLEDVEAITIEAQADAELLLFDLK